MVTKDMLIIDALAIDERIAGFFFASGMHCVGCPSSIHESLEEACMVHGLDVDEVFGQIQEYLNSKKA